MRQFPIFYCNKGGTMYHASVLINNGSDDTYQIYIIDGQNQTQIEQYKQQNNTKKWNPCIPILFPNDTAISITFEDINTDIFRDWYPFEICDYANNNQYYRNEYMFDGGNSITINNLSISDYIITNDTNYPILRSIIYRKASITVNSGTFTNITSSTKAALFYSSWNIYTSNSSFTNLQVSNVIFHAFPAPQLLVMDGNYFSNIIADMIISLSTSVK